MRAQRRKNSVWSHSPPLSLTLEEETSIWNRNFCPIGSIGVLPSFLLQWKSGGIECWARQLIPFGLFLSQTACQQHVVSYLGRLFLFAGGGGGVGGGGGGSGLLFISDWGDVLGSHIYIQAPATVSKPTCNNNNKQTTLDILNLSDSWMVLLFASEPVGGGDMFGTSNPSMS